MATVEGIVSGREVLRSRFPTGTAVAALVSAMIGLLILGAENILWRRGRRICEGNYAQCRHRTVQREGAVLALRMVRQLDHPTLRAPEEGVEHPEVVWGVHRWECSLPPCWFGRPFSKQSGTPLRVPRTRRRNPNIL